MLEHVFVTKEGKNRFRSSAIVFTSLAAVLGCALLFYNVVQGVVVLGILLVVWVTSILLVRKYAGGEWHPGRQSRGEKR